MTYKPKAREVQPAPEEVPVVHSSAYLLKEQQAPAATPSAAKKRAQKRSAEDDVSGNAFEWALRRADAYFDKVESEGDANRSARSLVSNPATQATMKTMQARALARLFVRFCTLLTEGRVAPTATAHAGGHHTGCGGCATADEGGAACGQETAHGVC